MDKSSLDKFLKACKSYNDARKNMITLVIFTAINSILIPATNMYFLFGISLSSFGLLANSPGTSGFVLVIIYSIALVAAYVTFALLSKKHCWAMIVLLVMFSIDCIFTIVIIGRNNFFPIVDFILHTIYLISLAKAVAAGKTLNANFASGVAVTESEISTIYKKENAKEASRQKTATNPTAPQKDIFGYDVHTDSENQAELRCRCCGAPRKNTNAQFCEYCGAPFAGSANNYDDKDKNNKLRV